MKKNFAAYFFPVVFLLAVAISGGCASLLDNIVRERVESPVSTASGKTTFYYVSDLSLIHI